jgi:hypothetical protein
MALLVCQPEWDMGVDNHPLVASSLMVSRRIDAMLVDYFREPLHKSQIHSRVE